jgi:hypothetical protein
MPESYDGNEGNDALAAGYSKMDGAEDRRDGWRAINLTRDYVAQLKTLFNTGNWPWARITGKPASYPPSDHFHTRLQTSTGERLAWHYTREEWNTEDAVYIGGYLWLEGTFFNPSTERVKRHIEPAPAVDGLFPELKEYERTNNPGVLELGYVVEDLVGTGAERFVKFDRDGQPEALAYTNLHTAQIDALNRRLAALEARDAPPTE